MKKNPQYPIHSPIHEVKAESHAFPLNPPHSDGTVQWNQIILVLCEISAAGKTGIGYTYADHSTARLIQDTLASALLGMDALAIPACWKKMNHQVRNLGRPGIASMAISAVDNALWDLKGKLLGLSVADLIGKVRDEIDVYGSGGLTSASPKELTQEFEGWIDQGVRRFKMKIGREPERDRERAAHARMIIGDDRELFVDANGAFSAKEALDWAETYSDFGVTWFEEPVSSDDLKGLRLLRDRGPAGMNITAGEYGYDLFYFQRMLEARAVDFMQADATRCGGITGYLAVSALCQAANIPLSSHTAPTLHAQVCCASIPTRHLEYFTDHAMIERKVFDGFLQLREGKLRPDSSRPGLGIELRRQDLKST